MQKIIKQHSYFQVIILCMVLTLPILEQSREKEKHFLDGFRGAASITLMAILFGTLFPFRLSCPAFRPEVHLG
ncbi:MAG: hypothetical protein WBM53_12190 [Maribacter sp.]